MDADVGIPLGPRAQVSLPTASLGFHDRPEDQACPSLDVFPGTELASFGGYGTLEILNVTRALEAHGIPCCIVGTSALIYYGADRGRLDWEICVPSTDMWRALTLLTTPPYSEKHILVKTTAVPQPRSLLHIYPRFVFKVVDLAFILVPSEGCHILSSPINIQRSSNDIPYPSLATLMQSLVDTHDLVALNDLVDGTNVAEEWGDTYLDLSGTNDTVWARKKNSIIQAKSRALFCVDATAYPRRQIWQRAVRGKKDRLGLNCPQHLFATRFRLHDSIDPWLTHREAA